MERFDVFYSKTYRMNNSPGSYTINEILTVYDINVNPDNGGITFLVYLDNTWQYIDSYYCTPIKDTDEEKE